jgi:hypothetical protein
VQITYLKQHKTINALRESIYKLKGLFENVPIWQMYTDNFTLVQYQHSQLLGNGEQEPTATGDRIALKKIVEEAKFGASNNRRRYVKLFPSASFSRSVLTCK